MYVHTSLTKTHFGLLSLSYSYYCLLSCNYLKQMSRVIAIVVDANTIVILSNSTDYGPKK